MIVLCRTKSNDGSGISNGMLRKYDIETGSSINSPIKECGTSLSNSISLVPIEGIVDAGIVSVNASNGSIAFYSLGSGRLLHRFFGQDKPCSTASSSDGFFYIVGTEEGDLRGWETKSGRLLFYVHRAHLQQINLIAMSSDNSHFVTASADGNVKIWSVDYLSASEFDKTHSIDRLCLEGHAAGISCLHVGFGVGSSFRVYSGARDGTVCVYDASDGMLLLKISLPFDVKSTTLESIAVSSSESCLYLASSDGNVYIVDMLAESEVGDSVYHSSKKVESRLIGSPQSPLTSIVLSLDEKFVLTGALDGTLSLWSTSHDRKLVRRWKTPDQEAICSLTMVCRSALISSASLEVSQPQRVLNGPLNSRLISSKTNRVSNASGEHVSAMPSSIETNLLINDGERVESMKRGYSFLLDFLFAAHRPV